MTPSFEDFCLAVTERPPFPWQCRLAARLAEGDPPRGIVAPTGLGKTMIMTAWAWALANQEPGPHRKVPMRLVYVAPRRVIVDDASNLAASLADCLEHPKGSLALEWARERLLGFTDGEGVPLATARLRGAIPRDTVWYSRVDQPSIIVSTTDMAGSGFLFRHWTSSQSVRPIVAGLLGVDAVWIVDESHVQSPLVATLERCIGASWERDLGLPVWWPVLMSATPVGVGGDEDKSITIGDDDYKYPVAKERLTVRRTLRLHKVAKAPTELQKKAVELAVQATDSGARSVLVVLNTVETARRVHEALTKEAKRKAVAGAARGKGAAEAAAGRVLLVHGQQREIERDQTMAKVHEACPMDGEASEGPWYVVTTSAIEVGADLSADHLVTESCAFGSLVQRAGRVGRRADNKSYVCDIIRACLDHKGEAVGDATDGAEDKVKEKKRKGKKKTTSHTSQGQYEAAAAATFTTLSGWEIRYGTISLTAEGRVVTSKDLVLEVPSSALAPVPNPAPLWPEDLLALACTRPEPDVTVDVQALIDGCGNDEVASVFLAWRSDLGKDDKEWPGLIESWPVRPHELVQVPVYAARELLGRASGPYAVKTGKGWQVCHDPRRTGRDSVIVVPTTYGGYGLFGFDPKSETEVTDVADVLTEHPDGPRLRVCPVDDIEVEDDRELDGLSTDETNKLAWQALEAAAADDKAERSRPTASALCKAGSSSEWSLRSGWLIWKSKKRSLWDDDGLCYTGTVTLADHKADVAKRALGMARRCGLAGPELEAVRSGAALHDDGKTNPTFQAALGAQPGGHELAKSGASYRKRGQMAIEAGLPEGWRHEAVSGALAERLGGLLVGHLAGASHGWGRPWYRSCAEPPESLAVGDLDGKSEIIEGNPFQERLDAGLASRFVALHSAYGPWALAWMEAAVRLADWEASGAPAPSPEMPAPTGYTVPGIAVPSRSPDAMGVQLPGLSADKFSDWLVGVGLLAVCGSKDPTAALCWGEDELHTAILFTVLGTDGLVPAVLDAVDVLAKEARRWESLKRLAPNVVRAANTVELKDIRQPGIVALVDAMFTRLSGDELSVHEMVANLSGKMSLQHSITGASPKPGLATLIRESATRKSLFEGPQLVASRVASFGFDSVGPGDATSGAARIDAAREVLGLIGAAFCARTRIESNYVGGSSEGSGRREKSPVWVRPVWHVPLGRDAIRVLITWAADEDLAPWKVETRVARSTKRSPADDSQYRAWVDVPSAEVVHRAPGSARTQVGGTKRG